MGGRFPHCEVSVAQSVNKTGNLLLSRWPSLSFKEADSTAQKAATVRHMAGLTEESSVSRRFSGVGAGITRPDSVTVLVAKEPDIHEPAKCVATHCADTGGKAALRMPRSICGR